MRAFSAGAVVAKVREDEGAAREDVEGTSWAREDASRACARREAIVSGESGVERVDQREEESARGEVVELACNSLGCRLGDVGSAKGSH